MTPSIVSVRAFGALAVTIALPERPAIAGLDVAGTGRSLPEAAATGISGADIFDAAAVWPDSRFGGTAIVGPFRLAEPA
jgi:hypothetical protein